MTSTPVACRSSTAVASSSGRLRPLMTTSTPASANARAQPLPSPWLDAQTMAFRPRIPKSMCHYIAGMGNPLFAADYKSEPYWWLASPRPQIPAVELPARCDVAIVGSGYTGLAAALELTRGGRQAVVFDAEDAGWGCSSRN